MASATGQIGKAVLSKLAKRSGSGAKKAVANKAKKEYIKSNVKAAGGIAKLSAKDALIKAGSTKTGTKVKNAVKSGIGKANVLSGKNIKTAAAKNTGNTTKAAKRKIKGVLAATNATKVARKGAKKMAAKGAAVAGVAAAAGTGVQARRKSVAESKTLGGRAKSALSTAKRKTQAGYKVVFGKLQRLKKGR